MKQEDFLEFNKKGWDELTNSNKPFSNTSLPEYGPFMSNEKTYQFFKDVNNKKVLDLGCASGKSLKYLESIGASELWGVDISSEQIKNARKLNIKNSHFFVSPMEKNPGIPIDYFDYVLSLYSIGYCSNYLEAFTLASDYLKSGGKFILSWVHPFFNCLSINNNKVVVNNSYNDENVEVIAKGAGKIELLQYNLKISTLVNGLIKSNFEIEKIVEQNPTEKNKIGNYKSPFFDERKLKVAPTTLLIVARKK